VGQHSYALARDANEQEIIDDLIEGGCSVHRAHEYIDLIVGLRGVTYLLEVKLPPGPEGGTSHSRLTPKEMKFHGEHKGAKAVVRCKEDARRAVGLLPSAIVSKGCHE